MALVDAKLRQTLLPGVFVCFADDPGGGVTDTEVEDFPCGDKVVEGLHELGDGGCEVPPMDVKKVDIGSLQLFETRLQRYLQALGVVPLVIGLNSHALLGPGPARRELGRHDHLISILSFLHPLPNPHLALLPLIIVRGIDEVPTVGVEVIEHLEGGFLGALAHEGFPSFAEVHGAQAERGDAHPSCGGEEAVVAQRGGGKGAEGRRETCWVWASVVMAAIVLLYRRDSVVMSLIT